MFAIVKTSEGWTVQMPNELTVETEGPFRSASCAAAWIAASKSEYERDVEAGVFDEPCDCCWKVDCVCLSGGCEACNATHDHYAVRGVYLDEEPIVPRPARAS